MCDCLLTQSSIETFRNFPVSLDHEPHTQNKALDWKPLGKVWKVIILIIVFMLAAVVHKKDTQASPRTYSSVKHDRSWEAYSFVKPIRPKKSW